MYRVMVRTPAGWREWGKAYTLEAARSFRAAAFERWSLVVVEDSERKAVRNLHGCA